MVFRPVSYRSFLYPQKWKKDAISWEVSSYDDMLTDPVEYYLSIELYDGNESYSFSTSNHGENGKRLTASEALKPLNDLIDALSKASIEFAKACNTPPKVTAEVKKPKASKNDKPKK